MLRLAGLAVGRGGRPVLEGLDLTVSAGEAVILRGPNGIGKTSLLRVVAGLAPPLAGRVEMAPEIAAYAAHADGLKSTLTAQENLRFWARIFDHPDPAGAVAAALEALGLTGLAERMAHEMSAGQKRRLGLARLLVTRRPLWLLDEPTVSLDVESVAGFAALLQAHLAAGGAAMVATHVALGLEGGRVLDLGPFRAQAGAGLRAGRRASFDEVFG